MLEAALAKTFMCFLLKVLPLKAMCVVASGTGILRFCLLDLWDKKCGLAEDEGK